MNYAIVLAAGVGQRMRNGGLPKQFLKLMGKPIVAYTLEKFEESKEIDRIVVVCHGSYVEYMQKLIQCYQIIKAKQVVVGGSDRQGSLLRGLDTIMESGGEPRDIVVIHDAIRPMISEEIISDCIAKCRQYGSGLAAMRCQETIISTEDGLKGSRGISRNSIMRVQTPQAYRYGRVMRAHEEAVKRGVTDAVYTNMLMLDMGETLYFSKGSAKNIKITTMEDVEIFKAIYRMEKEDWVK